MTFPYARTFDDVLAYVKKRRCVCGSTRTEIENRAGDKIMLGGLSAVRFDFSCRKCARLREFTFRTEEEPPRPPAARVFGLARSAAEAHLFMDLHPCEVCGTEQFERACTVVVVDGEPCGRYAGVCPECGHPREFTFRLPEEEVVSSRSEPSFGGERPSELLDAGEWLWVADFIAAGAAAVERQRARDDLLTAAAAVAEARKFVPYGGDAVSPETLRSPTGRAVYAAEPGRFDRQRLELFENSLRDRAVTGED
ncbi:hypothetical protein Aab01nite_14430 [Paractinoplanes abujensis]|uniref:Uncharacterized protein n=1 Tax=Paractinoplanes abujensis TaxID=882441 RepID=A0A7W7CLG3_9ACTN|nr:DUF2225 domain-containing protein [Actinoplanes abujensis]MBB4690734.1 hypothetical protein [Actinoplanes abujensis]GID17853.1 hypothetical protein Aab01nite_14430 [Actinoplanes abujensis]